MRYATQAMDEDTGSEYEFRLASSLKGYSIANPDEIPAIVELMSSASDLNEKKHILNAILSTRNTLILRRFAFSAGPDKIRGWIAEFRRDINNAEYEDVLQKMINILKSLPYDKVHLPEHKLREAIRQLAIEKNRSQALTKSATELANQWGKLTGEPPLGLSRTTSAEQSESARKKARLEERSLPSAREDRTLLPSFTKAKPAATKGPQKPQPRIQVNVNFFKEIGQQSTSTTSASATRESGRPARSVPSPSSTQPGNNNTTTPSTGNASPRASAPSSTFTATPLISRSPTSPVPIQTSRSIPTTTPAPLPKASELNSLSSQHAKAWEEAMRLKEQQSSKRKTVRFKNDNELVQVRIFARYQSELDDNEDDLDSNDGYPDLGNEEDDSESYSQYSPSPPASPSLPLPVLGSGTGVISAPSTIPYRPPRPSFLLPEDIVLDMMAGMCWNPPPLLKIASEHGSNDGNIASSVTTGEESVERGVQGNREKETPATVYRAIADIPPSPTEPDEENQDETELPKAIQLFNGVDYSFAFVRTMITVCGFLVNKTPNAQH
ncbi:hypothetical protein BGZ65_001454 [Modicella reniformis]|uniref:TFIIS N-terminal domain-containing protein n=1 Tax=Modicella reniformis TaxID=1440133 RepID=A0A9P6IMI2_9FUNG|nr:hypothetical protein BGZ65_001454 [Modicella reniformis]